MRALDQPAHQPCRQALRHLLNWGDGLVSATQLALHMRDAILDGEVKHPMVVRIADTAATQTGASARRLLTLLETCGFGEMVTPLPGAIVNHFVKPSTLLTSLHNIFPAKFIEIVGAREEHLGKLWGRVAPQVCRITRSPLLCWDDSCAVGARYSPHH